MRTAEPSDTALQLADVVVHGEPGDAAEWITRPLSAPPGASVAARPVNHEAWRAGTRDERVRFEDAGESGPVLASVALAWIALGRPLRTPSPAIPPDHRRETRRVSVTAG